MRGSVPPFLLNAFMACFVLCSSIDLFGDRGGTVVKALCYKSLVRSQLVSLEFFMYIKSFRSHYDPGVDSSCNRNEYQEHFLGVKATGA